MATRSSVGHPLSSWRLGGFRSIRNSTPFELGGLNIMVGANSAGKSSVLHSLLMVAQTLANPLVERPLVLNGHLVRLGLADDIIHESGAAELQIGFDLTPTVDYSTTGATKQRDFGRLSVLSQFSRTQANDFEVSETTVSAAPTESIESGAERLVMRHRSSADTRKAYLEAGLTEKAMRDLPDAGIFDAGGDVPPTAVGVRPQQFFPGSIWSVGNAHAHDLVWLQWAASRFDQTARDTAQFRHRAIKDGTRAFLRAYLQEMLSTEAAAAVPSEGEAALAELIPSLSAEARVAVTSFTASPWYLAHEEQLPFEGVVEASGLPPSLVAGLDYARRWFTQNVVHLGPLRAAPQPLYELPLAASETSVGRNGEFTAAVLNAHANRFVLTPDPDSGRIRQRRLGDAVNEWVSAIKLLSSVKALESGKLGYELQLEMEGVARDLDLTTVGVGVSQALPIIVLGLITAPGSLLLFEQPELHLHPDVQAALGDFFLALARTGRQIIVETHSDYLVNRLRRRAATDKKSDVPEQVRLFFFERQGSSSEVISARIAPGGGMPGWPQGFLDTASREVEAIAIAAAQRNSEE
jgi:predicted ATPase